ncbi:MAG: FkbM family methyltransferase [Amylibacter sp.]|nr:FkbM family methyltransferase [Amylibacter sp.]
MKLSPMHYYRLWRDPWRKVFWSAYYKFRADNGEARRMDLSFLESNDVVFDFGGFKGEWALHAFNHNGPTVHVFEPHPTFAAAIAERFKDNNKIISHALALGTADGTLDLSDDGDASSALTTRENAVTGRVQKAADFLAKLEPPVALAKLNIEGGEYDLLPALDQADWLRHIVKLQIQFHIYSEDDIARRDAIHRTLEKTHTCDWEYPFVWEQWTLR